MNRAQHLETRREHAGRLIAWAYILAVLAVFWATVGFLAAKAVGY